MDKDRIAGAARNIKGSIKEAVGKAVKVAGRIQNAIGGIKDALRE